MKKFLIISLVLLFVSTGFAGEKNLIVLHENANTLGNNECLACHADIKKENSLNQEFKTFHRIHLESELETPKNCVDCHASVDLKEGSASAVRKQVDPQLCAGCHSGDVKGAKVLFAQ